MWQAHLLRNPKSHAFVKVKGHATEDDVMTGVATRKDQVGNDTADGCATNGIREHGADLAVKWISDRHEAYCNLMADIHKIIVAVLKEEKARRTVKLAQHSFVFGFDVKKYIKADCKIRGPELFLQTGVKLDIKKPVKGKHKPSSVQTKYEDVSYFIAQQLWQPPSSSHRAGGTTWLELFIMFDDLGYRRRVARTI